MQDCVIAGEIFCAVQVVLCHSVWWVVMTADDKWLPDADVKHRRKGISSSWSPVSRTTPQLLTPSDPFSNPIPFPAASCPEWLLWLTPFMEEGGRGGGPRATSVCMYVCVCQLRECLTVCPSVCHGVLLQETHFVHKPGAIRGVCGILFGALAVCVEVCVCMCVCVSFFITGLILCLGGSPGKTNTDTN